MSASIIQDLERYAAAAGLSVSTVCLRATGNSRLADRLARRIRRLEADEQRLREYMERNPVVNAPGASCLLAGCGDVARADQDEAER